MRRSIPLTVLAGLLLAFAATAPASAGELTVISHSPARHSMSAPVTTTVSITFDRPVDRATLTVSNFHVFGRWSGLAMGELSYSNNDTTVTLTPDNLFSAGEFVMVTLGHGLRAADGSPLRSAGYSYIFMIKTLSTSILEFKELAVMSSRTGGGNTRIYGGLGSDLNGDGHLDLTLVNEDSADLRVLLNRGDRSGLFHGVLMPPTPVEPVASPNEPADFNLDGLADVCTGNVSTGSVSVVLGRGDGTFDPQQVILVGIAPHGIAVLDFDGDGDIDIATANTGSSNVALLENDGTGAFTLHSTFDGNGSGEYGLVAADMNNDGILDLIVGTRTSQRVSVFRGNGNATFTLVGSRSAAGLVWMIAAGDLNNDGNIDIAAANSSSANGSILIGDGTGQLVSTTTYPMPSNAIASDLGDLDGDGDLDWIMSDFTGGIWRVYTNDGDGTFTHFETFDAPSNPGCAVIMDIDNDRDLDLVLLDEIADLAIFMQHAGRPCFTDWDDNGTVNPADVGAYLTTYFLDLANNTTFADLDNSGTTNAVDVGLFLNAYFVQTADCG